MQEVGLPQPIYRVQDFMLIAQVESVAIKTEPLDANEILKTHHLSNDTLNAIIKKPNYLQQELAEHMGISIITIKRAIKELQAKGYIERIGSKKTGYWKVLKKPRG